MVKMVRFLVDKTFLHSVYIATLKHTNNCIPLAEFLLEGSLACNGFIIKHTAADKERVLPTMVSEISNALLIGQLSKARRQTLQSSIDSHRKLCTLHNKEKME